MGQFVTGLTVVTTVGRDGRPLGCTVSAFCPLSEEPPLVLVCIGRQRAICADLATGPGYAVNILRADHGELARTFADPAADRFTGLSTTSGEHGIPLLDDAIARIQCNRERVLDGGDHLIVIGSVVTADVGGGVPLLYSAGAFVDPTRTGLALGRRDVVPHQAVPPVTTAAARWRMSPGQPVATTEQPDRSA
jgi:flavin reductase (DIM6/NTAB) family NADH-FMN oxidoreductase RutF